jgi:glycine hydroxymethyltransferase
MVMGKAEFEKAVNKNVFPGLQGGPLMHIIAAKAVAFKEALTDEFKEYQKQIIANARTLAHRLTENGFKLVSGGTDTHLMLMDLRNTELDGRTAQDGLEEAGITVNKNTVPFETRKPTVTSGIRIGTPALTTRGMKEPEMEIIGDMIARVLKNVEDDKTKQEVRGQVAELCAGFPLYAERLEAGRK